MEMDEALGDAGEHAEAVRLQRGLLDVETRTLGSDHRSTLACASGLADSLSRLGEHAEAAVLLRTTLATQTRTLGPDAEVTLASEGSLLGMLLDLGDSRIQIS